MRRSLRITGMLAMALAVAHCGGNDVHVTTDRGVVPSPGTFTGFLSDGGEIAIDVGSIEAISFECHGEEIARTFSPPEQIELDGTFNVKFKDGGRSFRVRGTFIDNDHVNGTVDDGDDECDTSYNAVRAGGGSPTRTPTPAITPTGKVTTTEPTETPTSEETGEETPTSEATVTPGPGATETPRPCPVAVEVVGNAGAKKVLDTGWTGFGHDATVVSDGKLTFNVACSGTTRPCGTCDVSGPIPNLNADHGDINAHRCSNDPSKKCADDSACTAPGTCVYFFGAPLPLSAGGVTSCVVNQINGPVSGTANIESGAFTTSIKLTSKVALGLEPTKPCPQCLGDKTANDGKQDGTCSGGARDGQPCDVNGTSPITAFGTTSLDCVPKSYVSNLAIDLDGTSAVTTMTLSNSSPTCSAMPSKKCFCPAAGSQPTQPNPCLDDTSTPSVDESLCVPKSGGSNKGICPALNDGQCLPKEPFRGCLGDSDCPVPGDKCQQVPRPCFLDNGLVGGSVTAIGKADPPDKNGLSNPTFAALFCVPPVAASAINAAAGIPGLGRIELPLASKEILELPTP